MTDFHSENHRRLNILAGVWDTTITLIGVDGAEGATSLAVDTYRWMPNGHFLVHEVDAMMGDQRVRATEIFGVEQASGEFFSRSYDADGCTNDFASTIDGIDYLITGEVQRFAGQFTEDGTTLRGEWQQLANHQWRPFVRVVLEKRSQAQPDGPSFSV
ncbi:DUF1579 family protein [Devosia sp. XK-2]|uniref:DUF1579 family protein n=1 Tax=Devosia sp. XK-2 TaxID=3126689 RepID=UPI0030CAA90D